MKACAINSIFAPAGTRFASPFGSGYTASCGIRLGQYIHVMKRFTPPSSLPFAACLLPLLALALSPTQGRADPLPPGSVEFSVSNGSDLSATVLFAPIAGGIEITLTNTESGTITKGQAISALSFAVGGGLALPTGFYELTGKLAYSTPMPGVSVIVPGSSLPAGDPFILMQGTGKTLPYTIDHWQANTSGSTVTLATAGNNAPGGNPHWMILPSNGSAGPGASLTNSNFDPFIIGPASFFLTVPGVTTSTVLTGLNISNVQVGFGTGPDTTLTAGPPGGVTPHASATPAPSSVVLLGIGGAVLGFLLTRSRRAAHAIV